MSGRPTIWIIVGQGPIALAVGAGGVCLDIFTLLYPFSHLSPSLWETARCKLIYRLKWPLNPKQPTNQPKNQANDDNKSKRATAKKRRGRSGGAMVLGKLPVSGRPTIWIIVGQGPIALAVGAGGVCLDIFTLLYPFSHLSPSLWETARCKLIYRLKWPLNPKQPTNQPKNQANDDNKSKRATAKKRRGRSGGAMVLGKLPVSGRPTIWIIVGQGPIALAVGAGGVCLDIFTLLYPFSHLSPSLWETARCKLIYRLKWPLNPKQPTNQPKNQANDDNKSKRATAMKSSGRRRWNQKEADD